jgi:hypothetical protein
MVLRYRSSCGLRWEKPRLPQEGSSKWTIKTFSSPPAFASSTLAKGGETDLVERDESENIRHWSRARWENAENMDLWLWREYQTASSGTRRVPCARLFVPSSVALLKTFAFLLCFELYVYVMIFQFEIKHKVLGAWALFKQYSAFSFTFLSLRWLLSSSSFRCGVQKFRMH